MILSEKELGKELFDKMKDTIKNNGTIILKDGDTVLGDFTSKESLDEFELSEEEINQSFERTKENYKNSDYSKITDIQTHIEDLKNRIQ